MSSSPFINKCIKLCLKNIDSISDLDKVDLNDLSIMRKIFMEQNRFYEECFINLCRSILSGEYILAGKKYIKSIDKLVDLLNNGIPITDKTDEILTYITTINLSLIELCNNSKKFYLFVNQKVSLGKGSEKYIIADENLNSRGLFSRYKTHRDFNTVFIEILLPLCKYDYAIPLGNKGLGELLIIRDKIDLYVEKVTPEGKCILKALLFKSNFLIRRVKSNTFNWKGTNINPRQLPIEDYDIFKKIPFLEEDEINNAYNLLRTTEKPVLKDFVVLSLSCQKINSDSSIKMLQKIISLYDEFYDDMTSQKCSKFDLFSYNSVLNFLYNCLLEIRLKEKSIRLSQINEELEHINRIQEKSGIKNYYPFVTAIEHILHCIENHIASKNIDMYLMQSKFKLIESYLKKSKECLEWCSTHYFAPFQLSYEESIIEVNGNKVLVPSTFAKIVDYKEISKKIEDLKNKKDKLQQKVDLENTISTIDYFKEEIKKSEKKSIELLVIFSSAITFLFGSVNIFMENKSSDIKLLIANTTVIGLILILFSSLILLVLPFFSKLPFEKNNNWKSPRFWVLLIFVIFQITLLYKCYNDVAVGKSISTNKEPQKELHKKNNTIDSTFIKENIQKNKVIEISSKNRI